MLSGKGGNCGRPPYLQAVSDRNHDGRLLLAFLWRLDGEAASAPDDGEDVEEVDREH
jgi:hypothetical protein